MRSNRPVTHQALFHANAPSTYGKDRIVSGGRKNAGQNITWTHQSSHPPHRRSHSGGLNRSPAEPTFSPSSCLRLLNQPPHPAPPNDAPCPPNVLNTLRPFQWRYLSSFSSREALSLSACPSASVEHGRTFMSIERKRLKGADALELDRGRMRERTLNALRAWVYCHSSGPRLSARPSLRFSVSGDHLERSGWWPRNWTWKT